MPQDEFLSRVVIDPMRKSFYMYSDQGDEKVIECDNIDEFMNVLEYVNDVAPDEMIAWRSGNLVLSEVVWKSESVGRTISSIDFVSAKAMSAPFLVGITLK